MKNLFNKIFNVLFVLVLMLILIGCGGSKPEPTPESPENPEDPGTTPEDPGTTPEDPGTNPEDPGTNPEDPENPENPEKPYELITIAEAIEIATAAGETETTEKYYIAGKIVSISNPTYGEMTITDGTNSLYVYGAVDANGAFYADWAEKPYAGDDVVLYGGLKVFKGQPEMGRSLMVEFTHNEPEVNVDDYTEMTVADVRAAATDTKVKVTGVVSFITYANGFKPNGFYLIDDSASIYVYGSNSAQQVTVGNTVTVVGEKTLYINPDEANLAQKLGYPGAIQIQNPTVIENDKGNTEFNKTWIKESTVKDMLDTDIKEENITSDVFKVNALVKKVPGSGFTNYYFFDLDEKTSSYTYTACNGNDFKWLDEFDGKICTVYLSAINCKSTSAAIIYRFIPLLVEDNNFTFDTNEACEYVLKYYAVGQFLNTYNSNPNLEVLTTVSSELLGFENVELSYSSNNENVIKFELVEEVLKMQALNSGNAKVTITAKFGDITATAEVEISVDILNVSEYMTVKEVIDSADNTVVTVKGIVMSSLVNQTGFYLNDGTGVIAVTCTSDLLKTIKLGDEVVIEGKRIHKLNNNGSATVQSVIAETKLVVNLFGDNEYSTNTFITGKTIEELAEYTSPADYTTSVFVVKGKVEVIDFGYYVNAFVTSMNSSTSILLYTSSGKQYNWAKELGTGELTIELALCDWNSKGYKGCIISISDGTRKIVNNLNFQ